jgi:DNA-directed RNA polymerase subunit alpha
MNNISIKCLKSEQIQSNACYGQFLKFLTTWSRYHNGNQLRSAFRRFGRYSSAVRIAGVTHEFSTIPGVREDILEILLNLKGIVVKQNTRH